MKKLNHTPYFLYLLPVFFYLFGYTTYGQYLSLHEILLSFSIFTLIIIVLQVFTRLLSKRNTHAAFVCLFIMLFFYSFFGILKTGLASHLPFLSSYKIILPAFIVVIISLLQYLKRNENVCIVVFQYCNVLMFVLTFTQIILAAKTIFHVQTESISEISNTSFNTTHEPNIYFILLDEYAGTNSLKQYFHDDNAAFINFLRQKGFYVADTFQSNYSLTAASVNSILNIQYLNLKSLSPLNQYSFYLKSFQQIEHNILTKKFSDFGYQLNNLSIFDLKHTNTKATFSGWKKSAELLHSSLLHNTVKHDLLWKLCVGKYRMNYFYNKYVLHTYHQNNELITSTICIAKEKSRAPQFTYTHLLLPHEPYFTDSLGHLLDMEKKDTIKNDTHYLNYLKYSNLRIQSLVDSVQQYDPKSIIILLSDHGYRDYPDSLKNLAFNNFFAVSFPDKDYSQIKNIHSNVNVFRVILNQFFNQPLSILNDTSIILNETKNTFTLLRNRQ